MDHAERESSKQLLSPLGIVHGCSAVIFDMDGLMVDTERSARKAWRRFLARWENLPEGLEADKLYAQITGLSAGDAKEIVYAALGADFPFDDVMDLEQQAIEDDLANDMARMIKPGLGELLDLIESRGLNKAVATSTERDVAVKRLTHLNLDHRFQVIAGGDEVKEGKPKPYIYELAAARLGLGDEERQQCVVLEDSLPGVRAAFAAQMYVIMVRDPDLTPLNKVRDTSVTPDKIFANLHEARDFLEKHLPKRGL